jgi:hypothetical protein
MVRLEREMLARAAAEEGGDEVKAAERIGLVRRPVSGGSAKPATARPAKAAPAKQT